MYTRMPAYVHAHTHTHTHTCIQLVFKSIFVHILMNKRKKQCSGRCVTFDCFVSMILSVSLPFFLISWDWAGWLRC